ncbi:DNA ligase D [Geobacter sp. SVR]|uniref:DNA ligase D n=1 Tax=Geobacter sp. SVR TaxID=2495594 RepID=UPI00143EFC06|nr:DNA ligase D [Geobacter sp. SVR]BCS53560.1 ATP-dependent DNA ligase [Geobacter sp. SVR]GCF84243.1 ATP-dependent DNA ligase [Geobacter sp. SVR]
MSLKDYRKKRDFTRSPEPCGSESGERKTLQFVVQLHAASRLHYDFRLELDGVLKSWAVPKGPSLDPSVKRLALQVEDHPYDYRDFEGIIPAGNYGAGKVIVWDSGSYHAPGVSDPGEGQELLRKGLLKGDLKFVLDGSKLRGEFALVKTGSRSGDNAWLLIKKKDGFAATEDIPLDNRSVMSGLTVDQIGSLASGSGDRSKPSAPLPSSPPSDPMPHDIAPMLAASVKEPFDDPDWIFEIKHDGYRAIAEIERGSVRLYSRNRLPFNRKFPRTAEVLSAIGTTAVLDGELVVLDEQGRSQFQLLQNYASTGSGSIVYFVFDLLYWNGEDLRARPLVSRKTLLHGLLPEQEEIRYSDHVVEQGTAFFELARRNRLEGIIAKRGSSRYTAGRRSTDWLKIRIQQRQEAIICGYTKPRGSRKYFGSLALGAWENKRLVFIGFSGGGFDESSQKEIFQRLQSLVRSSSPFAEKVLSDMPVTWVEPLLVCEVSFTEWTGERFMRHPVFLGLREDKEAHTVVRETGVLEVRDVLGERGSAGERQDHGEEERKIRFTNLKKVFWPEEGITKGDVIEYYRTISPYILPYLKDRPQSLYRTPDGLRGESFYHKDVGELAPEWAATVPVFSESNDKDITYLMCQDRSTLLFMANLGCIEINPWLSRAGSLDSPDYCVIDLDPEEIAFDKVVETALAVRRVTEKAGAQAFPKTSGATGMHIYIPLKRGYSYDISVNFARLIAVIANSMLPDFTSVVRSPGKRRGKVYLDFLQNRAGQTLAAPYSLRPRPGAPVSTPLSWDEVTPGLDPRAFTIRTIHARLEKRGDLFRGVLGPGVDIEECIARLERERP